MNSRIASWFDKENIFEALIGQNEYFIPNHTYREDHDLLLVIGTLVDWAKQNNKEKQAVTEFFKVFEYYIDLGNLAKSLDLIHSYEIVIKHSEDKLPLCQKTITNHLKTLINKQAKSICQDETLKNLVVTVSKYLPEIAH